MTTKLLFEKVPGLQVDWSDFDQSREIPMHGMIEGSFRERRITFQFHQGATERDFGFGTCAPRDVELYLND